MASTRRIAIIGAGIGGLSAAYYLHGRESEDGTASFECTVFDTAERIGGNTCTMYGGDRFRSPFGDLGVNDINVRTYTLMDRMLRVLDNAEAASGHPFSVPMGSLLDTTCWYTPRGATGPAVCYTNGDLKDPDTPFLERISSDWHRFATEGADLVLNHRHLYKGVSVGEFVREQGYSEDFAVYNLYARINGMYFMDDCHPAEMPILGVMSYYSLQEGMTGGGMPEPDRRYFAAGASDWTHKLSSYLAWRGVEMRPGVTATVDADQPDGVLVTARGDGIAREEQFDAVILAVPADEVGRVVHHGLPDGVARILASFRYYASIGLWHDDDAVMPAERDKWRTYNIVIYPEDRYRLRPYTINYVCAMHQGRDEATAPFVSESPLQGVSRERVRNAVSSASTDEPGPAVRWFRHNMVSTLAMQAQGLLHYHQGFNNVYYTGGWTNGAGLHQEIMGVSLDIAKRLRGSFREEDSNTPLGREDEPTPMYLRVAADNADERHEDMVPRGFVAEE